MIRHIKKIGSFEVTIERYHPRVDGRHVNRDVDLAGFRGFVEGDFTVCFFPMAAVGGGAKVFGFPHRLGVGRVDFVNG